MEAFASYLLKSVIWLTGFTLVFFLFLRNERFFQLNRVYLVAGILTSLFFPLISVHYTVVLPEIRNFQTDSVFTGAIQNTVSIIPDLKLILLVLYLSGVLFVLTLIIRQGRSILRTIKKSEIISLRPAKLIKTPDYNSAFSFFSYVFVNPSVTDIETKEIMNHELVHIRQKHWFDLLLVELLCMIQWFNPLVWIYIRFIRQNHEYLADEVALQRTSDPAIYKAVLLNQIVGAPVVSLANSFNYSLNKKRFNMMKNIISSPYRKMKILLILPVFAIVLYAFAKPDYKYKYVDENSGINISGTFLQQNSVKGTVVQQDGKPLAAANITITGTTTGTITDAKGNFRLENIPKGESLVISFAGFKSKVLKPDFTSEMSITMVRDTVRYNNLNTGTPPPPPPPPPVNAAGDKNVPPPPPPPPASGIDIEGDGPQPLYVVDGSITTKADVKKINPESIEAISVLKNHSDTINPALYEYGEKGKNGVIVITSKGKAPKMLVIINGAVNEKEGMSKINTEDIESMTVLKDEDAVKKYGDKGKNGAIEVITFKKDEKRPDVKIEKSNSDDKISAKEPIAVVKEQPASKDMFVAIEELPEFPGGKTAMGAWIAANLKYPAEAVKAKISGKVYVTFIVSYSGKVKNVAISKSVSPLLNAEAIRVISSMPEWKPGRQGGKPVDVQMQVPVEFKLN
jgi:TonB family protein